MLISIIVGKELIKREFVCVPDPRSLGTCHVCKPCYRKLENATSRACVQVSVV